MIVVTGATGNVGQALVPKLKAAGVNARLVTRDPDKLKDHVGGSLEVVKGSLADVAGLKSAFAGADKLLLICPPDPAQHAWNVAAIDAAKAAGVKHIIKLSAMGASPESPIVLAVEHAKSEEHLKASGVEWTIVQPHYFMQNLYLSMPTLKGEGNHYSCMADGKISMVDVGDVAESLLKIVTTEGHGSQTYMLTGPEALGFSECMTKLGAAAGKTFNYVAIPQEAYAGALQQAGLPDWLAKDLATMAAVFGQGVASATTDTVEKLTGHKPTDFDTFAKHNGPAFA